MTEEEWLGATDPRSMIGFLKTRLSDRKARLFAVACCRMVSHLFASDGSTRAVEVAERFADDLASDSERSGAWGSSDEGSTLSLRNRDASWFADSAAESAVMGFYPVGSWYKAAAVVSREVARALPGCFGLQLKFLHCVFGNPFRPVVAEPAWLTPTVQSIAAAIYQDRAFDRLPILADALEEAGCVNSEVLLHCRQPGEHVRGCWVVDLVSGKE